MTERNGLERGAGKPERETLEAVTMEILGRLTGGIAHDFNNLLTAILGYSDLALERLSESDPARASVEQVRLAGMRGAALIQHLLALGRRQPGVPEAVDLGAVVKDLGQLLWRLVGDEIAVVTLVNPASAPILADRRTVAQLIIGLALHARDTTAGAGKLVLEVRNATADDQGPDARSELDASRFVLLLVTGSQASSGEDRLPQAVFRLVEQGGGHVRIGAEPSGASVRIYFPRASVARTAGAAPHERPGSATILLVEDEEIVRRLVREVMEHSGYEVLEATSGEQALALAAAFERPIHLLLTDVIMPGINGRELAERLVLSRPELRFIYMSGYTDDAMVHRGVRVDSVPFLQKPFKPAALLRLVRTVLA